MNCNCRSHVQATPPASPHQGAAIRKTRRVNDRMGTFTRRLLPSRLRSEARHLLGRDRRVGLRQLLLALRLVVERALVLVRVAVLGAVEVVALALEAEKTNLLVAGPAPRGVGLNRLRVVLRGGAGARRRRHGLRGGRHARHACRGSGGERRRRGRDGAGRNGRRRHGRGGRRRASCSDSLLVALGAHALRIRVAEEAATLDAHERRGGLVAVSLGARHD